MSDTTPTPEAVERLRGVLRQRHMWDHIETVDALLARVDAMTKERDAFKCALDTAVPLSELLEMQAERDAARAASGAVAEAMRDIAERVLATKTRTRGGVCGQTIEAYKRSTFHEISEWDLDAMLDASPDAAAALAEHDKRVREDERKACAEVARSRYLAWHQGCPVECDATACEDIADAILARKEDTDHDHR